MNTRRTVVFATAILILSSFAPSYDPVTLSIGAPAPDFNLPGTDGKNYTLASFSNSKLLAIVFTCNHCPTAQAYEARIMQMAKDYSTKGVALVAVSPND